ncbi:MAG: hypothetical protein ACOZF0_22950 [Thermodesulfobacteriota bacterium]
MTAITLRMDERRKGIHMSAEFTANGNATLIGSLPLKDHREAALLVLEHTPDIPLWVQLPAYRQEGMMTQFLSGFPGLVLTENRTYIDTDAATFEEDLLSFYEEYFAVAEGNGDMEQSRFALAGDTAPGFFEMLVQLEKQARSPLALKGQITGPFTLGTGLTDQNGRAIFYDERLRDVCVKMLAMKARWQVGKLSEFGRPVLIFFDEPALTGFGSSAFISISQREIAECFREVIEAVHGQGGLAGIHVCANAEWSLVLDSAADIVSFDAYAYFDRFLLYPEPLKRFVKKGGIIAWGIVPTLSPEELEKETVDSLTAMWHERAGRLGAVTGMSADDVLSCSLITPACGTGSLTPAQAKRALRLTAEVAQRIRKRSKDR